MKDESKAYYPLANAHHLSAKQSFRVISASRQTFKWPLPIADAPTATAAGSFLLLVAG